MKHILLISMIISALSCKAQNPIIPLGDYETEMTVGSYQKDVDNLLNPFEGTWKYENGSTSFTISLRKLTMYYNGRDYRDDLIGDYKYIENGVEVANYLPQFNNPNDAKHTIKGNRLIHKNWYPRCQECNDGEARFVLTFYDLERKYLSSEIAVRHYTENGTEKLKVWLYDAGSAVLPYEGAPESIRIPHGEYILIKQ